MASVALDPAGRRPDRHPGTGCAPSAWAGSCELPKSHGSHPHPARSHGAAGAPSHDPSRSGGRDLGSCVGRGSGGDPWSASGVADPERNPWPGALAPAHRPLSRPCTRYGKWQFLCTDSCSSITATGFRETIAPPRWPVPIPQRSAHLGEELGATSSPSSSSNHRPSSPPLPELSSLSLSRRCRLSLCWCLRLLSASLSEAGGALVSEREAAKASELMSSAV